MHTHKRHNVQGHNMGCGYIVFLCVFYLGFHFLFILLSIVCLFLWSLVFLFLTIGEHWWSVGVEQWRD